MSIAFCLGVHDRIDDLDAHLDILSFFPDQCELIVAYSHPQTPDDLLARWTESSTIVRVQEEGFRIGPLMTFCAGLKKASSLGCEWMVYRNADDWMFNHDMVVARLMFMKEFGMLCGAYNWLSKNTMTEFAMNEVTVHVPTFMERIDFMTSYFKQSSHNFLCEFKFAKWINDVCPKDKLYRLPGRERYPGVGFEMESIMSAMKLSKKIPSPHFFKMFENNHRFFNSEWQLIGSHNNSERGRYYYKIRHNISYASQLEEKPQFKRWLATWRENGNWNLPESKKESKLPCNYSEPTTSKLIKRTPLHRKNYEHGNPQRTD